MNDSAIYHLSGEPVVKATASGGSHDGRTKALPYEKSFLDPIEIVGRGLAPAANVAALQVLASRTVHAQTRLE